MQNAKFYLDKLHKQRGRERVEHVGKKCDRNVKEMQNQNKHEGAEVVRRRKSRRFIVEIPKEAEG